MKSLLEATKKVINENDFQNKTEFDKIFNSEMYVLLYGSEAFKIEGVYNLYTNFYEMINDVKEYWDKKLGGSGSEYKHFYYGQVHDNYKESRLYRITERDFKILK